MNLAPKDLLALDRSLLANERTFLAYFRTFIVFLSSGFAIIGLEALEEVVIVGYGLVSIAPILLLIGILRFFIFNRRMKKYFDVAEQMTNEEDEPAPE